MQKETCTVKEPGREQYYTFESRELAEAFIERRTVHKMKLGCMPVDGGNLFMNEDEYNEVLQREPKLKKFIRRCFGSREFIHDIKRYCFWLVDATPKDIKNSKILYERIENIKKSRLASTKKATQRLADTPHLFAERRQPTTDYLLIPRHSSEKRMYVPMGYLPPEIIVLDSAISLEHATPYHFAILNSRVHMAWMRRVCGRLRMDYRYSNTVVYNTFIWPDADPHQVFAIDRLGRRILDARENHPESSYADLYDEVSMPKDLRDAHRENDEAVCRAYGFPVDMDEQEIVNSLFKLYHKAKAEKKRKKQQEQERG